ncbi:gamma-crystallin N-B [Lates japonicus]|uniref:Gamma-crystallin N-B n=1 Tax=Lates japonicus TaxID=270547 RepID=A0AAD3ML36_LATJO|nr:gamma-crystallin N-B [Lates japonicus]
MSLTCVGHLGSALPLCLAQTHLSSGLDLAPRSPLTRPPAVYIGVSNFFSVTLCVWLWARLDDIQWAKMSQYSGKITFYEGKCFTGRKLEVRGDCDNFQDRGFMNRVNPSVWERSSDLLRPPLDFMASSNILSHGEYPEFQRVELPHHRHYGIRQVYPRCLHMQQELNFRCRTCGPERETTAAIIWQAQNPNIQSIQSPTCKPPALDL